MEEEIKLAVMPECQRIQRIDSNLRERTTELLFVAHDRAAAKPAFDPTFDSTFDPTIGALIPLSSSEKLMVTYDCITGAG